MAAGPYRIRELLWGLRLDGSSATFPLAKLVRGLREVANIMSRKELHDWCDKEINGYGDSGVPEYRNVEGEARISLTNLNKNYRGPFGGRTTVFPIRDGLEKIKERVESSQKTDRPSGTDSKVVIDDVPPEVKKVFDDDIDLTVIVPAAGLQAILGAVRKRAFENINALILQAENTLTSKFEDGYCAFIDKESSWEVIYMGSSPVHFPKRKGLLYIWEIIQRGGVAISVLELYRAHVVGDNAVMMSASDDEC